MKKAPNAVDRHIGARIRMRRMQIKMSQEKLGDALGLTFQQVQKYEKGTNRVSGSRMQQVADALKVPPSWLFEGAPSDATEALPDGTVPEADLLTRDGLRMLRNFQKITDPTIRLGVMKMLEIFARPHDHAAIALDPVVLAGLVGDPLAAPRTPFADS